MIVSLSRLKKSAQVREVKMMETERRKEKWRRGGRALATLEAFLVNLKNPLIGVPSFLSEIFCFQDFNYPMLLTFSTSLSYDFSTSLEPYLLQTR